MVTLTGRWRSPSYSPWINREKSRYTGFTDSMCGAAIPLTRVCSNRVTWLIISGGDEIQLLIGDLFEFTFIFLGLFFVTQKKFKSNISTASQALWHWLSGHVTNGWSKKKSEGLFRLGNFRVNFRWEFGCRKPPNENYSIFKTRQLSDLFGPEQKRGWFFGRWENLLKLDFLNSFQSHVEKQVQVLWMKMRMAWSFFWMLQCNVWILFGYLRGDF